MNRSSGILHLLIPILCQFIWKATPWSSLWPHYLVKCFISRTDLGHRRFSIRYRSVEYHRPDSDGRRPTDRPTVCSDHQIRCQHIGESVLRGEKYSHHCYFHLLCCSDIWFLCSTSLSISTLFASEAFVISDELSLDTASTTISYCYKTGGLILQTIIE